MSCDDREVVGQFHINPEPVSLDITLYSDSTFEETMTEVEGSYQYSGLWSGASTEGAVFHLWLVDSLGETRVLLNHGNYMINKGALEKVGAY